MMWLKGEDNHLRQSSMGLVFLYILWARHLQPFIPDYLLNNACKANTLKKESVLPWSTGQACLLFVIKDLCLLSSGFLSYNAPHCTYTLSFGLICVTCLGTWRQRNWYKYAEAYPVPWATSNQVSCSIYDTGRLMHGLTGVVKSQSLRRPWRTLPGNGLLSHCSILGHSWWIYLNNVILTSLIII